MTADSTAEVCCVCGTAQPRIFRYCGHRYHRCPECGLVSTYPVPDDATIEAHYARKFNAGNYELRRRFEQRYQTVDRQYLELLRPCIKVPHPSVLDVGCFTGCFLQLLEQDGWDVFGLELQPEAVEVARRRLPGRIFQADLHGDRFPQRQFDVVSLLGVIEHVTDPMRLLRRCAELLAPHGTLILQTPNSGSLLARALGRLWPLYTPVEHIHLFSSQALQTALSPLGLRNVRVLNHWKQLPVAYVYEMLQTFGPEFHRLLTPLYRVLPRAVKEASLSFYMGELILLAEKP
jgi:2-polyprenyl-3-methyl-5-hydroxy-6-metoxy-1,4-benzoquinol methylase